MQSIGEFVRLNRKIRPFLFQHTINNFEQLNLKVETQDIFATMTKIETIWKKIDGVNPLVANFYEESIKDTYDEMITLVKFVGYLAFLAICISILGLLGMVIFTTETRLKEISIRKVFGASERKLIFLLGKGFILLLLVSAGIAIPLTYLIFDQLLFAQISFRAPIGIFELFSGTALILVIALITIGTQTMSAAKENPALGILIKQQKICQL